MLKKIISHKKKTIEQVKHSFPLKDMLPGLEKSTRCFLDAIKKTSGRVGIIAEIKEKSPTEGLLRKSFDPMSLLQAYLDHPDVKAISILTEEKYFSGSPDTLRQADRISVKPLLRKDFIIDEYQVFESRMLGADAILLIAKILSMEEMENFIRVASGYGMHSIVEVHDEEDLKKIPLNAMIVGINNRSLDTMKIGLSTTSALLPKLKSLPSVIAIISESGIRSKKDMGTLPEGIDSVLIGTQLSSQDPSAIGQKIDELY